MASRYRIADGLSLRHLKAALRVHEVKNLTQAARSLNRSQTTVTKAILELEQQLGVLLFERSAAGMQPTVYGDILARRTRSALEQFNRAGNEYLRVNKNCRSTDNIPVFSMDIGRNRLNAFLALYDLKDVRSASASLGITTAAIYSSVREIERLLEIELFQRNPGGVVASEFATVLARHIKLAFSEIRHALDEFESTRGGLIGNIVIGAFPSTRSFLIPKTMVRLHEQHPNLVVTTRSGTYGDLELALRCGDVDLIVHARYQKIHPELTHEKLFDSHLRIAARPDHPLAGNEDITAEDLDKYPWIMPILDTGSRRIQEQVLRDNGVTNIDCTMETMYFTVSRGILMETDHLALLFRYQFHHEAEDGLLVELQFPLTHSTTEIGITRRANATMSPGAQMFIDTLREITGELR